MTDFNNIFTNTLTENNLREYIEHSDKFYNLYTALAETNKLYNLTAVTDAEGVCALHFADSLLAVKYIKGSGKLLDIGCGAGFPSLPIAIVRGDLNVHGIDSTTKKIAFSTKFASENSINNFISRAARAEELALTKERESYDYVTARAVARLNILAELALPFVKQGGLFISYKSEKISEEMAAAKNAIYLLGGKVIDQVEFTLPDSDIYRNLFIIKKERTTPKKYPRKAGLPAKEPLA